MIARCETYDFRRNTEIKYDSESRTEYAKQPSNSKDHATLILAEQVSNPAPVTSCQTEYY